MSSSWLESVVAIDAQPADAGPRWSLSDVKLPSQRRTVLKTVGAASLALGGSFLGIVSGARPAAAEQNQSGELKGWDNCGLYASGAPADYDPDRDTGGTYYNWQNCCHGGTYRASTYCTANGWHKQGAEGNTDFQADSSRCWGGSQTKNSWTWSASPDRAGTGTKFNFRCSDGKLVISGTVYNSVCRAVK